MHPFGQTEKLLEHLRGLTAENAHTLLSGGYFIELREATLRGTLPSREAFRQALGVGNLMPDLTELGGIVLPELSRSLTDRINDGGYDWTKGDITAKRFPLTLAAGPRPLVLAHFNKVMTSQKVEEWAAANGYDVALIDDLLAVGAHPGYRELQRQFPVLALGSSAVMDGRRYVPYLGRSGASRVLSLDWYDDPGSDCWRFLLVRKPA
jgi:hypothetical protein